MGQFGTSVALPLPTFDSGCWCSRSWILSFCIVYISLFQFCLMEHYFESPLSVLCCVSPEDREGFLDKMSHKQVEMFRKTLSFRR